MELKENIEQALNKQMNAEFYSSQLYLSLSAYFESHNLKGFAHWFRKQADEERGHAMKFYHYIVDRGGKVQISSVESPPQTWGSHGEAVKATYEQEKRISDLIHTLADVAVAEQDKATGVFLQQFITEQVEEEASVEGLMQKLTMIKDSGTGLLLIDKELAGRTKEK